MPHIKHIAFTVYPVTDMQKARAFYENDLVLTVTHNYNDLWVEYHLSGACLALMDVKKMGVGFKPAHDAGSAIAFEVDDLDGFVKTLRECGVKIIADNIEAPVCRQAYVMDPPGNSVGLHQKNADRA